MLRDMSGAGGMKMPEMSGAGMKMPGAMLATMTLAPDVLDITGVDESARVRTVDMLRGLAEKVAPLPAPGTPTAGMPAIGTLTPTMIGARAMALLDDRIDVLMAFVNDHFDARMDLYKDNMRIAGLMGTVNNRAVSVTERMNALVRLLDEAGIFTSTLIPAVDARGEFLSNRALLEQIALQAGMQGKDKRSFIRPVVVVSAKNRVEVEGFFAERKANVKIVLFNATRHGDNIIRAVEEGISELEGISVTPSYVALAVTAGDIDLVENYYGSYDRETARMANNFLIVNTEAEGIEGKEALMPAMNLVGILLRLAAREQPTLMAIGCDEGELSDKLADLKRRLGDILNLIRIKARNVGMEIMNMVDALNRTKISA
jgi:hypothetical protein